MALALLLAGCAKTVDGGCASDTDCAKGVRCDLATNRCEIEPDAGPAVCAGAKAGDDDPACGTIDCDALDDGCRDFADVVTGRCAGDGACKPPNDAATCLDPADLCFPYACDKSGTAPACRTRCEQAADCASGLGCPAGRCCDGAWETFTIDATGDVGSWARIAVDGQGNAHAAWFDNTLHRVRVGSNTALDRGAWTASTVPPPNPAFWYGYSMLSLGVDDAGTRHLLYFDANSNGAVYGRNDGSGWTASVVGGQSGTLAVAPNGVAHIVASDFSFFQRLYQFRSGTVGTCPIEAADSDRQAMTTDAQGRAHFIDWSGPIRYFAQGGDCDIESPTTTDCCTFDVLVAANGDPQPGSPIGRYSIAYDSEAEEAHVTYYLAADDDLRHAVCAAGSCSSEVIDATGDVGRYSSIVVGAGGLHVAYYDETNGHLRYATTVSGSWQTFVIDDSDGVGEYASLARGADGRLHAAYYDGGADDALYATLAPECVPGE